jgi:hypothetical protein
MQPWAAAAAQQQQQQQGVQRDTGSSSSKTYHCTDSGSRRSQAASQACSSKGITAATTGMQPLQTAAANTTVWAAAGMQQVSHVFVGCVLRCALMM